MLKQEQKNLGNDFGISGLSSQKKIFAVVLNSTLGDSFSGALESPVWWHPACCDIVWLDGPSNTLQTHSCQFICTAATNPVLLAELQPAFIRYQQGKKATQGTKYLNILLYI